MNKLIISLLSILLTAISCNIKDDFERKDELINYIKKLNIVDYENKNLLVVFLTGGCGECNEETIGVIDDLDSESKYHDYKKILIISDNNSEYRDLLNDCDFLIIEETFYNLSKYGINFYNNFIAELSNNFKIVKWEWLKNENIGKIKRQFYL